jgi:hypothetical protein
MPSRSREKQGESKTRRQIEDGIRSVLHARHESRRDTGPADSDHIPSTAESHALASRRCAARVADALKRIGYGFALIPSTAKPKAK